jgi:hypothetical protein
MMQLFILFFICFWLDVIALQTSPFSVSYFSHCALPKKRIIANRSTSAKATTSKDILVDMNILLVNYFM